MNYDLAELKYIQLTGQQMYTKKPKLAYLSQNFCHNSIKRTIFETLELLYSVHDTSSWNELHT